MEYYYYCENDWNENLGRPIKVYLVEKPISDPHPETIKDPKTNKKVKVKRYFDSPPAVVIPDPNAGGYRGKYGKFMNRRKEAMARRGQKTVPEMVKELGLYYDEQKQNRKTGELETFKKYINSDTVPTYEWEQLPESKRRLAEKYGFLPMKEMEAPAVGYEKVKKTDEDKIEKIEKNQEMEVIYIGKIK